MLIWLFGLYYLLFAECGVYYMFVVCVGRDKSSPVDGKKSKLILYIKLSVCMYGMSK